MKLLIHFILFALFVTQIQSNPIANTETTDSSLSNTKIVPDDPKTDSSSFHNNIPFSSFPNNIGLKSNTTCPPPLILYTEENAPDSCLPNGCCLPCPVVETFYKENLINTIYSVLSIVRVISFTCILVVVISYLVLPNKRDRPALTVLLFNVSLLIFIGVTFFYIGDHKRVQCYNEVIQSTMENNPVYCGAQGLILIFSTFHLILWCFLLILHLHCQTVWRSNILQHYYIHSHVFIWTMAIAFTVLNGVTKSISFEFGVVCLVSSKYAETYFWFPLAGFVMLGFLIHTWTVWHITKSHWIVTKTSLSEKDSATTSTTTATTNLSSPTICVNNTNYLARQEIIRILKIQWRALLLAVIFLITYSFYWAYVRIEFPKLETLYDNGKPAWLLNWLSCILSGKGQNFCSQISMPNIPNVIFLVVAEFFTGSAGIWVFIVFGTSINLWTEWRVYLANKFSRQKVLLRANNA